MYLCRCFIMRIMARYRKLRIELTDSQRKSLEQIVRKGTSSAMEIRRANVLLLADEAGDRRRQKDVVIAKMLGISAQAVHDIKFKFLDRSDSADDPAKGVRRKKRASPPVPAKCTGDVEAMIIAIACSAPPEDRGRWTLRLISERVVELGILASISHVQVGRILKKTSLNLI